MWAAGSRRLWTAAFPLHLNSGKLRLAGPRSAQGHPSSPGRTAHASRCQLEAVGWSGRGQVALITRRGSLDGAAIRSDTWRFPLADRAPSPEGSDFLDIEQAAAYLGMSVRWLRRRVDEKSITHHKAAGLIRFHKDDLDAFMEAARVPAERPPSAVGRPRRKT